MSRLTIAEAATELRKSERWLRDWLAAHPQDALGRPFFARAGRTKLFTAADIDRIRTSLEQEAVRRIQRDPLATDGWIYFVEGGEHIKIGFTRSATARFHKMRTDAPFELKLIHMEPGTFKTERLVHREFTAIRLHGEWFRKDAKLLAYIERRKAITGNPLG